MRKEDKTVPHQRIAKYFFEKFKIKGDTKRFLVQMNIAKSLLEKYSEQDLIDIIDYLRVNQPKGGVFSLKYLDYVMDNMLPKAKEHALRNKEIEKGYDLSVVNKIDNTAKRKKKKSMFA